jgi:hypothetical protein
MSELSFEEYILVTSCDGMIDCGSDIVAQPLKHGRNFGVLASQSRHGLLERLRECREDIIPRVACVGLVQPTF